MDLDVAERVGAEDLPRQGERGSAGERLDAVQSDLIRPGVVGRGNQGVTRIDRREVLGLNGVDRVRLVPGLVILAVLAQDSPQAGRELYGVVRLVPDLDGAVDVDRLGVDHDLIRVDALLRGRRVELHVV